MSEVTRLPGLGGDAPAPAVLGLRKVAENSEEMAAVGNLLKAMEGMQEQLSALTDLVIAQDARIEKLEKAKAPKLISVRS